MKSTLYTRPGCPCCEQAEQMLVRHGLSPEKINIDADEKLREAFHADVPVVEIDGKIRFRGRVDARLLKRLLQHRGRP